MSVEARQARLDEYEPKWHAALEPFPGDDAFDGQTEPQLRELTARERDVLCGLLNDVVFKATRENTTAHIRGGKDWLYHLLVIREVITPRED